MGRRACPGGVAGTAGCASAALRADSAAPADFLAGVPAACLAGTHSARSARLAGAERAWPGGSAGLARTARPRDRFAARPAIAADARRRRQRGLQVEPCRIRLNPFRGDRVDVALAQQHVFLAVQFDL